MKTLDVREPSRLQNQFLRQLNSDLRSNLVKRKNALSNTRRDEERQTALTSMLSKNGVNIEQYVQEDKLAFERFMKESATKLKREKHPDLNHRPISDLLQWPQESAFHLGDFDASFATELSPTGEEETAYSSLTANVGELNLVGKNHGAGFFGIEATAANPAITNPVAVVEYSFIPNVTGTWSFMSALEFHGFYRVYADDSWWNSRDARVQLDVSITAGQYFVGAGNKQTVLKIEDDNINTFGFYDNIVSLDYSFPLRAGDPATVYLTISVEAYAHGDDSYAELNFADGFANFIRPLETIALINP